jgi:hypothetical protein
MLRQFNSGTKKQIRTIPTVNIGNLSGAELLQSLTHIMSSSMPVTNVFNSNTRFNPELVSVVRTPISSDLTGSLYHILSSSMPVLNVFESNTRSNPNPITITNNTNTINDFHTEILKFGARYVSRQIDAYDNDLNTLTIYSASLDYGTEGASAENFEILVNGLHVAGNYTIKEVGNNVVITLGGEYIEFDTVQTGDVYVFGKFLPIT